MAETLAIPGDVCMARFTGEEKVNAESRQRSDHTGRFVLHNEYEAYS